MGLIGGINRIKELTEKGLKLLKITGNTGGGADKTGDLYQPSGIDSAPLKGDFVYFGSDASTNGVVAIGFLDSKAERVAKEGEIRTYARNSDGDIVAFIYIENTGKITIKNDSGEISLDQSGEVTINGSTFDTDGVLTALDVILNNVGMAAHIHSYTDNGTPMKTGIPEALP